jgi:hypothetical protein
LLGSWLPAGFGRDGRGGTDVSDLGLLESEMVALRRDCGLLGRGGGTLERTSSADSRRCDEEIARSELDLGNTR